MRVLKIIAIFLMVLLMSLSLVSGVDTEKGNTDKVKEKKIKVDCTGLTEGLKALENIEINLKGLEALEGLEGLEALEGLKALEGLEGLEGLKALEALDGLEGLEALEVLDDLDLDIDIDLDLDLDIFDKHEVKDKTKSVEKVEKEKN